MNLSPMSVLGRISQFGTLLAVVCLLSAFWAPPMLGADPAGFLPLGELVPAAQDAASQAQMLQGFVRQLQYFEGLQSEGDVRVELVHSETPARYDMLRDVAAKVRKDAVSVPSLEDYTSPTKSVRRWVFKGINRRNDISVSHTQDRSQSPDDAQVLVYDGTNTSFYYPAQSRARVCLGRSGMLDGMCEPWITLSFVDNKPISSVVSMTGARYEGRQTVGSVECHKISVGNGGVKWEIWLDGSHGWRAKRFVQVEQGAVWTAHDAREVESYIQCDDGAYFPSAGKYAEWLSQAGSPDLPLRSTIWSTLSYAARAPEDAFRLQYPSGTKVTDYTSGKPVTYGVGE